MSNDAVNRKPDNPRRYAVGDYVRYEDSPYVGRVVGHNATNVLVDFFTPGHSVGYHASDLRSATYEEYVAAPRTKVSDG